MESLINQLGPRIGPLILFVAIICLLYAICTLVHVFLRMGWRMIPYVIAGWIAYLVIKRYL
jgi:hypothetical protein